MKSWRLLLSLPVQHFAVFVLVDICSVHVFMYMKMNRSLASSDQWEDRVLKNICRLSFSNDSGFLLIHTPIN